LVPLAISSPIFTSNIRGKRYVSQVFDGGKEVFDGLKLDTPFPKFPPTDDFGTQLGRLSE
jgi:hypothetical protein